MSPIQHFKDVNNEDDENNSEEQQVTPLDPENDQVVEDRKLNETVDFVEKIQQKFPKHELEFWEFQEKTTCLPEVVVAMGIKVSFYNIL